MDVFESPLDSMANQEDRISLSEYKERVDSYLKDLFTTSDLEEFILYNNAAVNVLRKCCSCRGKQL